MSNSIVRVLFVVVLLIGGTVAARQHLEGAGPASADAAQADAGREADELLALLMPEFRATSDPADRDASGEAPVSGAIDSGDDRSSSGDRSPASLEPPVVARAPVIRSSAESLAEFGAADAMRLRGSFMRVMPGMTRSQVATLLGTPAQRTVGDRWVYAATSVDGRARDIYVVMFSDGVATSSNHLRFTPSF